MPLQAMKEWARSGATLHISTLNALFDCAIRKGHPNSAVKIAAECEARGLSLDPKNASALKVRVCAQVR